MARTKSNIVIRRYDPYSVMFLNVAKATTVAQGDLVDFDGTDLAIHSGDNSDFTGVALSASSATDIQFVSTATRGVIYLPIVSGDTDSTIGDGYKYNAGSNTADWNVAKATAEGIMWAMEVITAGTSGRFYIDSHSLGAGFLFDALTEG